MSFAKRPETIVRRPENIGPWIVAAAVIHALLLIIGACAAIEYQKAQIRNAIKSVQEELQAARPHAMANAKVGQSIESTATDSTGERVYSATISNVQQTDSNPPDIEFQFKNTSQWAISRLTAKIQFSDRITGKATAIDKFTASVPDPIKPGETRKLVFTPPPQSPLRRRLDDTRGSATLVTAE